MSPESLPQIMETAAVSPRVPIIMAEVIFDCSSSRKSSVSLDLFLPRLHSLSKLLRNLQTNGHLSLLSKDLIAVINVFISCWLIQWSVQKQFASEFDFLVLC